MTCGENMRQLGRLSNTTVQVSIVIAQRSNKNKQGEDVLTSQSTSNSFHSCAPLMTYARGLTIFDWNYDEFIEQ